MIVQEEPSISSQDMGQQKCIIEQEGDMTICPLDSISLLTLLMDTSNNFIVFMSSEEDREEQNHPLESHQEGDSQPQLQNSNNPQQHQSNNQKQQERDHEEQGVENVDEGEDEEGDWEDEQEEQSEQNPAEGEHQPQQVAEPHLPQLPPPPPYTKEQLVLMASECKKQGQQCEQVKNYQGALPMYLMATDMDPDNVQYYLDVGRTFYMMGEYDNAFGFLMTAAEKGIKGGPRALTFNYMGNILQSQERYEDSLTAYSEAIKSYGEYAGYYYNRGISYKMLGDFQNAVKDFSTTVSLQNDYANAYENRAFIYYIAKVYKKAISDFTVCLLIDDQNPEYWSKRGSALDDYGKPEKALADFDQAIQLRGVSDDFYNRGITYSRLNNHEKAIEDFDKAIEKTQKKFYYENRARSYDALKMTEKAEADREAASKLPETPTIMM